MRRPEFLLFLLFSGVFGCSEGLEAADARRDPSDSVGRVVILAVDGAAREVLDELFAQGRLPHLKGLVDRGCYGSLKTHPSSNSCLIWTSIATGVFPKEHGIDGFVYEQDGALRLFTSGMVRYPRLWELASDQGVRVGVTNYWVTFPVTPVEGFVISDHAIAGRSEDRTQYFTKGQEEPLPRELANLVYPAELAPRLGPILKHRLEASGPSEPPQFEWYHSMFADDVEVFDLAREAASVHDPRLNIVYVKGIDEVSHFFWGFYRPDARVYQGHPKPSERDLATFRHVVPSKYEHTDALIGEAIAGLDDEDVVIVLSDHGFSASVRARPAGWERGFSRGDHGYPEGEPPSRHGLYIISGGPVSQQACPAQVKMYDIAPTSLYLLDLPVPGHMRGRVVTEFFGDSFLQQYPVRHTAAAQPRDVQPGAEGGPAEQELTERLRALGYLD
jgi:hypothetical protein